MKSAVISKLIAIYVAFGMGLVFTTPAFSQAYKALENAHSVDTIFDFRQADPKNALAHLRLVYHTYVDGSVNDVEQDPNFVVVFMAGSVELLSRDRQTFSAEEKQTLEEMDRLLSKMRSDGIVLEVCLVAIKSFDVEPDSISPEIERVGNGWISSLGYQHSGYALVPVF